MEADAVSSKYAYQAEYIDLPVKVDYIQAYSISGSSLWFMGNVSAGKETYVDEATGESYEYDNYENQLFRMDLTTQECVQIPLPEKTEVPEGWQGDAYTQEMCAGSDGTVKKQPVKKGQKVGRNDPCPCGSGKKYKKCCGMHEDE